MERAKTGDLHILRNTSDGKVRPSSKFDTLRACKKLSYLPQDITNFQLVVDETSARSFYDKETSLPLQADHVDMARFKNDEDSNYEFLRNKIRKMTKEALNGLSASHF